MRPGDDVSLWTSTEMHVAASLMGVSDGVKSWRWVKTGRTEVMLSSVRMTLVAELANDEAVVKVEMTGVHYVCWLRDLRPWF